MVLTDTSSHPLDCQCTQCAVDIEWLCPDHLEPTCQHCERLGHVTCHHPDHEDYCPGEQG